MERDIKQFKRWLMNEIEYASYYSLDKTDHERFTERVANILVENGQFDSFSDIFFEEGKVQIDGYKIEEDSSKLHLFTSFYKGNKDISYLSKEEIIKRLEPISDFIHGIEHKKVKDYESAGGAQDFISNLQLFLPKLKRINLHIFTDSKSKKFSWKGSSDSYELTLEVWDLEGLNALDHSSSLNIKISDLNYHEKIQCLDATSNYRKKKGNYKTYLAIFPGALLAELYEKYSTRLLEKNVRSFLSVRNAVNKGIRETLHDEPEKFLAFNNGISLTATKVKLQDNHIHELSDMQIVNGGQTVASLHRALYVDEIPLDNVYVMAKINSIDTDQVGEMVPLISKYSNTQSAVKNTDLTSNHIFHKTIEDISRSITMPNSHPSWFYERSTGEYEVMKERAKRSGPEKLESFESKFPKGLKIQKTDLAKVLLLTQGKPHISAKGPANSFTPFMNFISEKGENWIPDENFYKDAISKWIIYRELTSLAKDVLQKEQFKVDTVIYTMAYFFNLYKNNLDLDFIWNNQTTSKAFNSQASEWLLKIHESIKYEAENYNVASIKEFCKKEDCWFFIKDHFLDLNEDFKSELKGRLPVPSKAQKAISTQSKEDTALINKAMSMDTEEILKIHSALLPIKESLDLPVIVDIIWTLAGYANNGWEKRPSVKQAIKLFEARELAGLDY